MFLATFNGSTNLTFQKKKGGSYVFYQFSEVNVGWKGGGGPEFGTLKSKDPVVCTSGFATTKMKVLRTIFLTIHVIMP